MERLLTASAIKQIPTVWVYHGIFNYQTICMKYIVMGFLVIVVALQGCKKENNVPETPFNEMIPSDSTGNNNAKYAGNFSNGPYGTVSGNAKVYFQNGKYVLALESVAISNGPDLHVYLSKEIQPINFIDLGKLKSTNGNQLYEIKPT